MAIYYLDASAVVKYFHNEPGSVWVMEIIRSIDLDTQQRVNSIYICSVSIAEVPAAFAMLWRSQRIGKNLRDTMYRAFFNALEDEMQVLHATQEILYDAARLTQQYPLKGYDAIQLAVALNYHQSLRQQTLELVFVTGDNALLQAARAEGLAAENPFDHQ